MNRGVIPDQLLRSFCALMLMSASLIAEEPATAAPLPDPEDAAYPAIERFIHVLEKVRARHPETDKLAYERLVNHALEGMLGSLDPHSSYIHPEMAALLKSDPTFIGHIPSLGLTVDWRPDGPYLSRVVSAANAANADSALVPGAAVMKIDGHDATELAPQALVERLQKPAGETMKLTLLAPDTTRPKSVELTHRVVESRAVAESRLLANVEPATGYVRLASFTPAAPREMAAALDDLEDRGMTRLVLDLRGNPGGSLDATVSILGLLVPPGTDVVTVRGRDAEPQILTTAKRQRRVRQYPVAVLIDQDSASASELTAGALQDLERATVVGETSYGKGSVQEMVPTGNGTAVRLTIATYHTPSGRTPHRRGIEPDVPVALTDRDREMLDLTRRRESLSAELAAKLEDWSDPVLAAALAAMAR